MASNGLKLVDIVRKPSRSVVCVTWPLKIGKSKHFSARVSAEKATVLMSLWTCTASLVTSNEPEVEVVGGRKVWEMLKGCTVGIVKSVFSRFCSNTTAEVKHKSKDVQPGNPLK